LTAKLTAIPGDEPLYKTIKLNNGNKQIEERRVTKVSNKVVKGGENGAQRG
jgi:uncharacterized protein YlzI (FlbEa/FlbD family)